jgi:hypothetical protein
LALYWVDIIGNILMMLDKSVVCPVFIGRQNDLQSLDRLIAQLGDQRGQIALSINYAEICQRYRKVNQENP